MGILQNKLLIKADLELLTGLHIGSSNEFAPIGAVDNIVIRDPRTNLPIIPGSSLKGKMRSLLSRDINDAAKEHKNDNLGSLFGQMGTFTKLQFFDLFMNNPEEFTGKTDLPHTEIKFENVINRERGTADHPRQIERVPAGSKFKLYLIYNLETGTNSEDDFEKIVKGFKLVHLDYIGGSGTRGYGRVKFSNFVVSAELYPENSAPEVQCLQQKLNEVKHVLPLQTKV